MGSWSCAHSRIYLLVRLPLLVRESCNPESFHGREGLKGLKGVDVSEGLEGFDGLDGLEGLGSFEGFEGSDCAQS